MGNFASEKGVIRLSLDLPEAKLFGAHSILGRSVVVHEKEGHFGMGSDEESQQSGCSGPIIAYGVIGITSPSLWEKTGPLPRKTCGGDCCNTAAHNRSDEAHVYNSILAE
ncbi:superoxide dismutase [Cu-Zn] [Pimephales promelas]|nr:superoxide dismutase [Cu-Zn] [Pimephales promelas]